MRKPLPERDLALASRGRQHAGGRPVSQEVANILLAARPRVVVGQASAAHIGRAGSEDALLLRDVRLGGRGLLVVLLGRGSLLLGLVGGCIRGA